VNLTTVTDLEAAVERHYCESLFLAAQLPSAALRVADIGSGAGFPGFPVAVLRPECAVTLIESHQRKAVFLREATRSFSNVRVLAMRAEQVGEQFDWAVSRAVSYADLSPILKKLAANVELLMGAEAPPEHMGFAWSSAIPLPWGEQRFLRTGHRVA
jgi:16S rRNA (guanine(527)-N(7))-methyltransferase RsmG